MIRFRKCFHNIKPAIYDVYIPYNYHTQIPCDVNKRCVRLKRGVGWL